MPGADVRRDVADERRRGRDRCDTVEERLAARQGTEASRPRRATRPGPMRRRTRCASTPTASRTSPCRRFRPRTARGTGTSATSACRRRGSPTPRGSRAPRAPPRGDRRGSQTLTSAVASRNASACDGGRYVMSVSSITRGFWPPWIASTPSSIISFDVASSVDIRFILAESGSITPLAMYTPQNVATNAEPMPAPSSSGLSRWASVAIRPMTAPMMPNVGAIDAVRAGPVGGHLVTGLHGADVVAQHGCDRLGVAPVDGELQTLAHEREVEVGDLGLERQQTFVARLAGELHDQGEGLGGIGRRRGKDRPLDGLEHAFRRRHVEAGHGGAQRAADHDEQGGHVGDQEHRADACVSPPRSTHTIATSRPIRVDFMISQALWRGSRRGRRPNGPTGRSRPQPRRG